MDHNSMKYRESLIKLRNFVNSELDSQTPNPKKFAEKLEDEVNCVLSNTYVLIREKDQQSGD